MDDSIYVINVGGYIGESTRSEIGMRRITAKRYRIWKNKGVSE